MTWLVGGFGGGETRDALIEGATAVSAPSPILASGWVIITSPVKNGTGAIRIPAGNTNATLLLSVVEEDEIWCMQALVNYDGNPAATHYLMTFRTSDGLVGFGLQVGTDRRVRLTRDPFHGDTPLTAWSADVLGNGAYTLLTWFLDPLTLGTNNVWGTVVIDNVAQIGADLGRWPFNIAYLDLNGYLMGPNASVDIRLDDIAGMHSTSIADAPHLAAAPIVKVAAQHPNAAGASDTWTMFPNTGEVRWQDWDDATGNDGDTTYLQYNIESLQDSDFQSNADVGMGAGAVILEFATGIGPVWSAIHRAVSGTKWLGYTYCNAANQITLADPGSSYVGTLKRLTRTSGSWVDEDLATLKAGAQIGMGTDILWRITSLMLQWAYYDTTLGLTPAPVMVTPFGQIF